MPRNTENLFETKPFSLGLIFTMNIFPALFLIFTCVAFFHWAASPFVFLTLIPAFFLFFYIYFLNWELQLDTWRIKNIFTISEIVQTLGWLLLLFSVSLVLLLYFSLFTSPLIFLALTPGVLLIISPLLTIFYPRLGSPIDDANPPIADPPLLASEIKESTSRIEMSSLTDEADEKDAKESKINASLSDETISPASHPLRTACDLSNYEIDMQGEVLSFLDRDDLSLLSRVSKDYLGIVKTDEKIMGREMNFILQDYGLKIPDNKLILNRETICEQLKIFERLCRDEYIVKYTYDGELQGIASLGFDRGPIWRAYESSDPALFQGALSEQDLINLGKNGNSHQFYKNLERCSNKAAAVGNFRLVKWLTKNSTVKPTLNTLKLAVRSGNLNLARWLVDENRVDLPLYFFPEGKVILELAIMSGNPMLFEWLVKKKYSKSADTFSFRRLAAYRGRLDIAKQVNSSGWQPQLEHIALSGNVEMMKQALSRWDEADKPYSLYMEQKQAALSGSLPMMQMLIDRQPLRWIKNVGEMLQSASLSGSLPLVQWLLTDKYKTVAFAFSPKFMTDLLRNAVKSGSLNLVKWLMEVRKINPDQLMLRDAVGEGRFNVVKYLIAWERGVQRLLPDEDTLVIARGFKNQTFICVLEQAARRNNVQDEKMRCAQIAEVRDGKRTPYPPSSSPAALAVAVNKRDKKSPLHPATVPLLSSRGEEEREIEMQPFAEESEGENDLPSAAGLPGMGYSMMDEVD